MESEDKATDLVRAFLGVIWQDWESHRRKCCFTQTQFAKHLLILHEKYCPTYLTNSNTTVTHKENNPRYDIWLLNL